MVVDGDGWLVTNYHVIQRASKITVTLTGGTAYEARFVSERRGAYTMQQTGSVTLKAR